MTVEELLRKQEAHAIAPFEMVNKWVAKKTLGLHESVRILANGLNSYWVYKGSKLIYEGTDPGIAVKFYNDL